MFRPRPRTLVIACLLALAFAVGRWSSSPARTVGDILQWRMEEVHTQGLRWHEALGTGALLPGERHAAHDALATLRDLEALYREEEALWTYYDVLERALALRRSYGDERAQLEQRRQQQEADLAHLDQQLQRLRPRRDPSPTFNSPDAGAWWHRQP